MCVCVCFTIGNQNFDSNTLCFLDFGLRDTREEGGDVKGKDDITWL